MDPVFTQGFNSLYFLKVFLHTAKPWPGNRSILLFIFVGFEMFPEEQERIYDSQQKNGIANVIFPGADIFRADQYGIE
jgi:hypothetical protein